jgi:hypothetical protein
MIIHTIVFILDNDINIPIQKSLFPPSARRIHILSNPEEYGWKRVEKKTGICSIDMKGMSISADIILSFMRIIRTGYISPQTSKEKVELLEHFAILIGAGEQECTFREAADAFYAACKREAEIKKIQVKLKALNPMVPDEDIYELYHWSIGKIHDIIIQYLPARWDVTISASALIPIYYVRKRRVRV